MAVVLIIDDDPAIRELWRAALEAEGHRVLTAPSGLEGVEIARSQPIEVVVTDLYMPGKDGIETVREIKRAWPGIRVLIVSGGGRMNEKPFLNFALKFGAEKALQKPVELDHFCAAVDELVAVAA